MGWRGRRGRVGHSAAGRTFAPSQVNHSRDVSWGWGWGLGLLRRRLPSGRGHGACEGSEPCGSPAPTYPPGGWGFSEVTGTGPRIPPGWGLRVFGQ